MGKEKRIGISQACDRPKMPLCNWARMKTAKGSDALSDPASIRGGGKDDLFLKNKVLRLGNRRKGLAS